MKNKILLGSVAAAVVLGIWFFTGENNDESSDIFVEAKRGTFRVEVTTTGELEAQHSVKVLGPTGLRAAQMWNVKIEDLVDEGTVVEKGQYIGRLDQSELSEKLQNRETELQQSLSKYTQTKLDTALELRGARDELINLKYAVEEKEIILSQSQYEPPATIKQAEIDLAKSKRTYEQAVENYKLKSQKAVAEMQEAAAQLSEDQGKFNFLDRLRQQFTILAPEAGMVVYHRDWDGSKQGIGATLRAWNPIVATLPDLSSMISRTFVNEVDIRVVKKGQQVKIGLDAFPDKELTGQVVKVANIGEQQPNSDSKVFEVEILIHESDTTLRPAMTTSNSIIAKTIPDVIFVPLECLHSQGDTIAYVIKKNGLSFVKQAVIPGQVNANEVVIEEGVAEGEKLYLSIPDGVESQPIAQLKSTADASIAETD